MTLTISKCKLSKQQHTITLNYTLGENEKSSLIFTLMICRNFFAHRNAVCKTRDDLAHLKKNSESRDMATKIIQNVFSMHDAMIDICFAGCREKSRIESAVSI